MLQKSMWCWHVLSLSLTYVLLMDQILDEVERRRGISAALVYPFMRSLMESPFPAPGKTIKVKTFLPGAGNEVKSNCKHYKSKPYPLPLQYQNSKRKRGGDKQTLQGCGVANPQNQQSMNCTTVDMLMLVSLDDYNPIYDYIFLILCLLISCV